MDICERENRIISLLRNDKSLSVNYLSEVLGVSQVTIRKDLTRMEKAGLLIRSYGKALLPHPIVTAANSSCFIPPEVLDDFGKKQLIGSIAAEYVDNDDFIYLGPGYTCLEVAKNLKDKARLNIVTTNISAAIELADAPEKRLIVAPGDFTRRNGTYYVTGTHVPKFFEDIYFNKIFFTVDGVSLDLGFSVFDDVTRQTVKAIIKPGSQVFVCATGSKFGKNAFSFLGGGISLADYVITDSPLSQDFMERFRANSVKVIYPAAN
jgi:DeoR/GlpR family transcriptional regulator of sugar metabolism